MRDLPFPDDSFGSVASIHSIEHVPDAETVLREVRRVLEPGGVAVFQTPNRLTFGRPDEIIDPYHDVEYSAEDLRQLCAGVFEHVELHGMFASPRVQELLDEQARTLDRLLALDPLRLRRFVPRRVRQVLYDLLLTLFRRRADPRVAAVTVEDFELRDDGLDAAVDVLAVCR